MSEFMVSMVVGMVIGYLVVGLLLVIDWGEVRWHIHRWRTRHARRAQEVAKRAEQSRMCSIIAQLREAEASGLQQYYLSRAAFDHYYACLTPGFRYSNPSVPGDNLYFRNMIVMPRKENNSHALRQ